MNRFVPISLMLTILLVACAGAEKSPPPETVGPANPPITFIVNAPAHAAPVYLTGNLEALGPWDPARCEMTLRDGCFTTTLLVPSGTALEYKFTRGTWDTEALDAGGGVPQNHTHTVVGEATLTHSVPLFRGPDTEIPYPDPSRWESEIQAYEQLDMRARYTADSIVAIGSSSMKGWHDTISEDLAPLRIIPRGFGGSMMNDALHFADRIVLKYKPSAILLYEGDNDIAHGVSPKTVHEKFTEFCKKVWADRADTRIYVLSAKPSPDRQSFWPRLEQLNELLADQCTRDERLVFIDIAAPMLSEEGRMRPELYLTDQLHMNAEGYKIWTRIVREKMVERELRETP